jgi:hypothetical protein
VGKTQAKVLRGMGEIFQDYLIADFVAVIAFTIDARYGKL